jgi:hypothetical protein
LLSTYTEQHVVEREWAATLSGSEIKQFTRLLRKMLAGRTEPTEDAVD